jgi:hypothetical protein
MKTDNVDRYIPLETALKGAGFKVDEVEKQGKKTIITISRHGKNGENPVSPQRTGSKWHIKPDNHNTQIERRLT